MPAMHFETNPVELRDLLRNIHLKKLALPDFQRDFVWEPDAIAGLLGSLASGYPAGSLLTLRRGQGTWLEEREVEGAPKLDPHAPPEEVVLDGQQRLTSLYGALHDAHTQRFFVNLQALLDDPEAPFDDAVEYHPSDRLGTLDTIAEQGRRLLFPLGHLLAPGGFFEWLDDALAARETQGAAPVSTLRKPLRELYERFLKPIETYRFPVIRLPAETAPAAVCRIFSTINSTGVRLTTFDLLAARWWPAGVRLRSDWKNARAVHPIVEEFLGENGAPLLQAMCLRERGRCTDSEINRLEAVACKTHWSAVVAGFAGVLTMLRDECGLLAPRYTPYLPAVVGLAAAWTLVSEAKGPKVGEMRARLKRWFWCVSFGGRYDASANSRLAYDYRELITWLKGGHEPRVVASFDFAPGALREVRSSNAGLYRAVLALQLSLGALDFHKASPITADRIGEGLDDHHVFPRRSKAASRADEGEINCVLNRALIDPDTNRRISNRNPSDYLAEIREQLGQEVLDQVLASHGLPTGQESPLAKDKFSAFLQAREQWVVEKVQQMTGAQLKARAEANARCDLLGKALEAAGLKAAVEADDGDYYGFGTSAQGTQDRLWLGRWDHPRIAHSAADWLWVQWFPSTKGDKDGASRWKALTRALSGGMEFSADDGPVTPIRLDDVSQVAAAVARFFGIEGRN